MYKYSIAGILFLSVILVGCSTGVITQHKWDKDADFGKYKTYGFEQVNKLGSSDVLLTEENLGYVKSAIRNELDVRGYSEKDSADLLVLISVKLTSTVSKALHQEKE